MHKRQFWIILMIVFLGVIGISIPYLIFPVLFLNPAYSILPTGISESSRALFLGITLASYPLGQFIGSPILGALSDDYGRKRMLSGSLLITALCNLLTGVAIARQHLIMLIVSRFMAGLMEGNIAIARAMAADLKMISKYESFGKVNAVTSIAYLIGPLVGGLLSDKNIFEKLNTSTPFFLTCILFFCLALLSALILKESITKTSTQIQTFWQRINFIKKIARLFSNKQLKHLMIASTLFTFAIDIFYEFGPVYLTVKWTLGPAQLIIYNGVLCLGLAVGNGWLPTFFSSRESKRLPIWRLIIFATSVFPLFLIGIVLVDSTLLMMVLFTLSGLAIGLAMTLFTVKISDSVSDAIQGEVLGTQISLRVLGDGIICLVGGALLILSSKLILIVAAVMSLVSMSYYKLKHKF